VYILKDQEYVTKIESLRHKWGGLLASCLINA